MNLVNLPPKLKELLGKLEDKKGLYLTLAKRMKFAVDENFETEGRRLGKGWEKLTPKYARAKRRKKSGINSILQLEGNLKKVFIKATDDYAAVGTNLVYAAIHQKGGTINHAARSEIFTRNRFKRPPRAGQFKKGTKTIRRGGKGFTYRAYIVRIPARPFLELNDVDMRDLVEETREYLK